MSEDQLHRERLSKALDGVDGWLDITEAWQLHECARRRAGDVLDPCVVEIGSWKGRSAIALALGLEAAGGRGIVHAIDPHGRAADGTLPERQGDRQVDLEVNLRQAGVTDRVDVIVATSHVARPRFTDATVDLLFVDGSHEYPDVLVDIDDWTSSLREGAVIAFNDPGWSGVNRALRERTARGRPQFRRPWFVFNTLFFEYGPSELWTMRDTARRWRLRAFLSVKRGLEVVWRVVTPRLPNIGVALLGLAAWGLTRAFLRSSPYPDASPRAPAID